MRGERSRPDAAVPSTRAAHPRGRFLATCALVVTTACAQGDPPASQRAEFALRDVVKPALAAATQRAPIATPTSAPAADPEAIEAVLGTLESPDARMRGLALADAKALGDSGVAALAAVLADPEAEPARRTSAAHALGAIATPAAVDALLSRLEVDREPWLRAQCAWQVRTAGLDEALPRLSLRLKYETDGATVVWIADALSSFDNLSGLDALRVLRDTSSDESVRVDAANLLETLARDRGFDSGEALYAAWWNGDPDGRLARHTPSDALVREAWACVGRLAVWDLRRVDDARFTLVLLESWIVPFLISALHDVDVYTRIHAAQCLERRGPRARAAVPELIAALVEPRLAAQAATALAAIGDPSATGPIEELLGNSRDVGLRIAAARALGRIGGESSLPLLRAAWAADQPIDLRQAAAGALVRLGEGDAVAPFLLECLGSTTADAGAAEHALGDWLTAKSSAGGEAWMDLAQRWRALEPAPGSVPDAAQVDRRRSQRADLARAAVVRSGP